MSIKNWFYYRKRKLNMATKRSWIKYWVQLKGNVLYFYKNEEERERGGEREGEKGEKEGEEKREEKAKQTIAKHKIGFLVLSLFFYFFFLHIKN